MSFGTGHHATTYMMIEQMKELEFKNKTIFDFGTGTGILAILAEKLGAASVSALDIDEWSIKNAKENIDMNDCYKISLSLSSVLPDQKFDILTANIKRNVILNYLPKIKSCVKQNGYLLLSGLLEIDEKDIVDKCSLHHLNLIKEISRNNWISLLFVKG
jgi:ribosomal protein L11 methyltransferase